jgi:hypothetical protein
MHFTREPIIETVITPREGNKLVVRSSKTDREEYCVEALEVVSFGASLFFRSTERPNSFLLPVTDYEIYEAKEMKTSLKVFSGDRSIRIGGGRDASVRPPQREQQQEESAEEVSEEREQPSERFDKKRDRRRRGRRRGDSSGEQQKAQAPEGTSQDGEVVVADKESVDVAPSFISKLFPPPPTLIKETLSRYKIMDEEAASEAKPLPEDVVESAPDLEENLSDLDDDETKIED